MNYQQIKRLAKEHRISVRDLIALAPQNDPFYVGTKGDIAKADWFGKIWRRFGYSRGIHLRRIHYQLVSQDPPILKPNGEPYENTENDWGFLTQASKCARYLDVVNPGAFVDRRNPKPERYAHYWGEATPSYSVRNPFAWDIPRPEFVVSGYSDINLQPYLLEVWVEKTTMNDVLAPLCRRYSANLITGAGELSITATLALVRRIEEADRPCRIFYVSDFDPAGYGMPVSVARKIEFFLSEYDLDLDVRLEPIVLTHDQVGFYQLPRTPIKATERRRDIFEGVHGEGAVELDALEALHPGELGRLVETAILAYYDQSIEAEARDQQRRVEETLNHAKTAAIADLQPEAQRLQDQLRDLFVEMTERLETIDIDLGDYPVPEPQEATESNGQLFSSKRGYLEQLSYYQARRQGVT